MHAGGLTTLVDWPLETKTILELDSHGSTYYLLFKGDCGTVEQGTTVQDIAISRYNRVEATNGD